MREPREYDLGWEGRRCVVHDLSSVASRQVARRLINIVGKAMRQGATAGALEADAQMLGLIGIATVLETLDDATTTWLTNTFIDVTTVETEPGSDEMVQLKGVTELCFSGADGLARWMRWLSFCVETSCGDFFAVAFAEAQRLQTKAAPKSNQNQKASGSPSTSSTTGTFTA